ncbi:hypothetical protein LTR17_015717 [Elasticomyces elasticus]|nr:hypothetical protein LTR17_015717 [Elasticomyces elasticus]
MADNLQPTPLDDAHDGRIIVVLRTELRATLEELREVEERTTTEVRALYREAAEERNVHIQEEADLKHDLDKANAEIEELRKSAGEKHAEVVAENAALKKELVELREKLEDLEGAAGDLKARSSPKAPS